MHLFVINLLWELPNVYITVFRILSPTIRSQSVMFVRNKKRALQGMRIFKCKFEMMTRLLQYNDYKEYLKGFLLICTIFLN